ncbi:MAG TPA: serine/threonine-protein kinase [Pirellulales bacterium]|nr:serine/threonine-protein kinase [Pirellulales bacterium]
MNVNPLQAREIFVAAVKLPPDEWDGYLERVCAGDRELRERVADLLQVHREIGSFMEQPAVAGAPPAEAGPAQAGTAGFQAATEAPGTWIGPYRLLQRLGEGGMGVVWAAEQTEPVKRRVALKLIKPGMDSALVLRRFEAERQALALMDHSNIAKVLDAGTTARARIDDPNDPKFDIQNPQFVAGRPYFVMELVKGVPITKYCDELHLTLRERLELFVPVCQAIQHAHTKGIIHRDIKPSNVLVAIQDGRPVSKVIDFGVAKALYQPLTDGSMFTEIGQVVGTLEYMSPEQAELSALDIDTRADVYALGVLLYELLTGTTPLDRKRLKQAGYAEMLRMIREDDPPKPSTRLSESKESLAGLAARRRTEPARLTKAVRGELDWIVMRCLEKDRMRRYETANGLARDVERHLHDEPVEACPPSSAYKLRKFLWRHKRSVLAAALVLLALVGGVIGTTWGLFRAVSAENDAVVARDAEADERRKAVAARDAEITARRKAEILALGIQTDQVLETINQGRDVPLGLLELASLLLTVPDHAPEWKEYLTMSVLAWGQTICPLVPELSVDGFDVIQEVWSEDGKLLLTRSEQGALHVWEVPSCRLRVVLRADEWPLVDDFGVLGFSTDGQTVWATEHERSRDVWLVRLWDTATGMPRGAPLEHPTSINSALLTVDGERCITLCDTRRHLQLWDALSGSRIAVLTEHDGWIRQVMVSPDSRIVVADGDGPVQIWSARDGHRMRALGTATSKALADFSPSGDRLATLSGNELRCWHVDDWLPEGPVCMVEGYDENMFFVSEDVINVDFSECCVHGRGGTAPISPYRVKDQLVLTDKGRVYDLSSLHARPQVGHHRFSPEAAEFAEDGRRLLLRNDLWDLATERPIGDLDGNSGNSHIVCSNGVWWISPDSLVLLPEQPETLDAEAVVLWAGLVARGEINEDDKFAPWDEATWEAKRQALLRLAAQAGAFPFPGPMASDRLYWLRRELEVPSVPSTLENQIEFQDRLIAAEPTWRHYHDRSLARVRPELAFQDALEAGRLAGPAYWRSGLSTPESWKMVEPDQPHSQYELVLRWFDQIEAGGGIVDVRLRALALYRLGRYAEALAKVASGSNFAHSVRTDAVSGRYRLRLKKVENGNDVGALSMVSMCQYQLGELDEARTTLRKAWDVLRVRFADYEGKKLLHEAEALIEPPAAAPEE